MYLYVLWCTQSIHNTIHIINTNNKAYVSIHQYLHLIHTLHDMSPELFRGGGGGVEKPTPAPWRRSGIALIIGMK